MDNLNVSDIIKGAFAGKPTDVEAAFNSAIQSKMSAAIDARREQIAQSMYGEHEESDDDLEDSDVDADEEDLELEPEETDNEDI
jgi:hypothetical protein